MAIFYTNFQQGIQNISRYLKIFILIFLIQPDLAESSYGWMITTLATSQNLEKTTLVTINCCQRFGKWRLRQILSMSSSSHLSKTIHGKLQKQANAINKCNVLNAEKVFNAKHWVQGFRVNPKSYIVSIKEFFSKNFNVIIRSNYFSTQPGQAIINYF